MSELAQITNKSGYKKNLLHSGKKHATHPLKDHTQLALLGDVLSRKEKHHLILITDFSEKVQLTFLEALAQHLTNSTPPRALSKIDFFYLDIRQSIIADKQYQDIDKHSQEITETLEQDKCTLLAINQISWLDNKNPLTASTYNKLLHQLLTEPQGRIIVLTNEDEYQSFLKKHALPTGFISFTIHPPIESEALGILKIARNELEEFHQVILPEEALSYAYEFAQRYLNHTHALDKALLLLDSSAARASQQTEQGETSGQFKPLVTLALIANVLASWTGISPSQLQQKKFKISEFTQGMQQRLFGQEMAIATMGYALQQSHLSLQEKSGPFCGFLFVGPAHVGKKTAGYAFAELLFKQPHACFYANFSPSSPLTSLAEIKTRSNKDHRYHPLTEVIRTTPFGIIFLDNIQYASAEILHSLEEIFSSGYLISHDGQHLDFQQTVIIMATTLGTERILELAQPSHAEEETHTMDLMQLVLSEHRHDSKTHIHPHSAEEISDEIMPLLNARLPSSLLH